MLQRLLSFFQRLLGKSSDALARPGDEDRRGSSRQPSSASMTIVVSHNGKEEIPAQARNVSRGGISLIVYQPFRIGDVINVRIPAPVKNSQVLACIVHVKQMSDEEWALGCSFSDDLGDEEMIAFGAEPAKSAVPSENRSWLRIGCDLLATFELVDDPEARKREAKVINLSLGGVGLSMQQPPKNGELMNLTLRNPATGESLTMLVCVVHVTARENGYWSVGCNFMRDLSERDVQALS